jgi:hypothetical protein
MKGNVTKLFVLDLSLLMGVNEEEKIKSPGHKLTLDELEQRAAYEIACGDVGSTAQYPVTAYQVLEALQVSNTMLFY